jgi:hypothetical protein
MHGSARCEIRVPGKTSSADERLDGMNDTLAASDIDPFSEALLTGPYPGHTDVFMKLSERVETVRDISLFVEYG